MIEAIIMKNCATYTSEGQALQDCKKINFIYGPNGSGKSTISNFLKDPSRDLYKDSEIKFGVGVHEKIIVYNKKFREENFRKDNINGVFTLGQENVEDVKKIEELKNERSRIESHLKNVSSSREIKIKEKYSIEKEFKEFLWVEILKKNEDQFGEAFVGFRNNKDKFKEEIINSYKLNNSIEYNIEDLKEKASALYGKKPEKCFTNNVDIVPFVEKLKNIESNPIWKAIIIGKEDVPLSKLISRLENSEWVAKGREYLSDDEVCPFCQQKTITDSFRRQLRDFFDEEYQSNKNIIRVLKGEYKTASTNVKNALTAFVEDPMNKTIGKLDVEIFHKQMTKINNVLDNNFKAICNKDDNASLSILLNSIDVIAGEIISTMKSTQDKINIYNNIIDNYMMERAKLTSMIWSYLINYSRPKIAEYLHKISSVGKAIEGISKQIERDTKQINDIGEELNRINSRIISVLPTVNEINRSLQAYGFSNFKIVQASEDNKYQIQRENGELATNTLSEGEETFITFLYFMQLIKGGMDVESISTRKILVIDDPISSLDSTIMYIVSTMVKDLIDDVLKNKIDVNQIFILTHNVFFHKEASQFDGRSEERRDVFYWTIRKDMCCSTIKSYRMKNPISTSYELLWLELKDETTSSMITIQNTMRRILEYYFRILGNCPYNEISKKFQSVEERRICDSLFSWINDGSHSIPDDLYYDGYSDSIEKYKEVFRQVFINVGHDAHYNMMLGIHINQEELGTNIESTS